MQLIKQHKKTIIYITVVTIAMIVGIIIYKKLTKTDYYYEFSYDDNLITQSVNVYDKNNILQSSYVLYNGDEAITITSGTTAVLSINKLDLKNHPKIEITFMDDEKKEKHKVSYGK